MKSILTIVLLLSAIFSYGQKTKTKPCSKCWSYADNLTTIDSLRLWIDKVNHMYCWEGQQWDALWNLLRAVDILQARIEVLEKSPFFETDSTKRIIAPKTYSTTGRMVDAFDSIVKLLPKTNCKP